MPMTQAGRLANDSVSPRTCSIVAISPTGRFGSTRRMASRMPGTTAPGSMRVCTTMETPADGACASGT